MENTTYSTAEGTVKIIDNDTHTDSTGTWAHAILERNGEELFNDENCKVYLLGGEERQYPYVLVLDYNKTELEIISE